MVNEWDQSTNCIECNEPLKGRSDKKFCDDHCRSTFNNRRNRMDNNTIRKINLRLNRNRRILKDLYSNGKKKVKHLELSNKGFVLPFTLINMLQLEKTRIIFVLNMVIEKLRMISS